MSNSSPSPASVAYAELSALAAPDGLLPDEVSALNRLSADPGAAADRLLALRARVVARVALGRAAASGGAPF